MEKEVIVVGAGLAGSEAAYQLAKRGIKVKLYEMKAKQKTPAHSKDYYSELVCSNSLGSDSLENASGLMKEELRILGSMLIEVADRNRVPAGQALAVDRDGFSEEITKILKNMENIEIIEEEFTEIPEDKIVIIASGPLTSDKLFEKISEITGEESLYFYDAAAPIVTFESIDMNKAYFQSRYGKGDGEYINCPMNKEEYYNFYNELIKAERAELKNFEKEKLFDACMPIEKIAMSGEKTMTFGPLKPKGLINPKTDKMDYAVVQLRQDDKEGKLYNIVGFQTNLKFGEQKRVFSMIPGLENAEFVRYGVMHRNTFINSTKLLDKTLKLKNKDNVYFAGQITGGEGYVTAIATGMYAAINVANRLNGEKEFVLEDISEIGAIVNYITEEKKKFQPMGANFGIIRSLDENIRDKKEKYRRLSQRAIEYLKKSIKNFIYYLEFEENKKHNTVISIRKDLNQFLIYLNEHDIIDFNKLDELLIKEYFTKLKTEEISASTFNRRLSSIKKFYKYLVDKGLKEKGSEILIESEKNDEKKIEYLSPEEINLVRATMQGENFNILRDRLMFELLYSSGMTVAELLSLGEVNFNLEKREIYILKNKLSKTMYFSETCKKFYIKFLNSKKEKFKEAYNPNIIFTNNSNERLTDRSVRRLINKYGEMANLNKEISPYTLRHSFCIYMLKNGMPKEYLARLLDLKVVGLLDVYEGLC